MYRYVGDDDDGVSEAIIPFAVQYVGMLKVHGMLDMGCWTWDVGHGMLDVGFWTWDVGHGMLDVGCWTWDVGHGMLDMGCWT